MIKRQPPPGITTQDWDKTPTSVQTLVYTMLTAVEEMQQIMPQLQKQIEQQQKRINQLEEQVGKSSRNSSKPPSSDPPNVKKPPPKAQGERKQGGQPGHKGHGRKLKPPEEVTRFVVSKPSQCQECGTLLLGTDPQPQRHQVCELPPIEPEVIEYQAHALTCLGCGHKNQALFPREMPTGSFGPRVQGLMGYLSGRFSVSRRDVEEIMTAIFQVEISLGGVSAQEARLSAALEHLVDEAQNYVQQQAQINTDETSWAKNNKRQWLWTASTELVTIFLVVATRSADGFKQLMTVTRHTIGWMLAVANSAGRICCGTFRHWLTAKANRQRLVRHCSSKRRPCLACGIASVMGHCPGLISNARCARFGGKLRLCWR